MIYAAENGHKDIVEYLVSQGAEKDIKDNVSTHLAHTHIYMYVDVQLHAMTTCDDCMQGRVHVQM